MSRGRGGHDWDVDCKIFVGGLRDDANRYDIEDTFSKYGRVRDVWVARKPPGFAFVVMEDSRDAQDAAKGLDGSRICGAKCRVEMSVPGKKRGGRGGSRGRSRSRSRSRSGGRRRRSPSYSKKSRSRSRSRDRKPKRERSDSRDDRKRSTSRDNKRSRSRDRKSRSRS